MRQIQEITIDDLVVEATRDTEAASKAAKQTKDPYRALEAKLIDVVSLRFTASS